MTAIAPVFETLSHTPAAALPTPLHPGEPTEYDALAGIILALPSRQASLDSIAEVQAELDTLSAETTDLDLKFQERQRQFQLLVHSIKELRETLRGTCIRLSCPPTHSLPPP